MTNHRTMTKLGNFKRDEPCCSFCGKEQSKVKEMLAGPSPIFICNACLHLGIDVLYESDGAPRGLPLIALRQWHHKVSSSFENLMVDTSNRIAYDSARNAVAFPGQSNNNPLLIYGGTGLGKTHLLQATANEFVRINPDARVCYLHCGRFIEDVVRAYQTNKLSEFSSWYQNLDLFLIDDIEFIAGKAKSQEVFTLAIIFLLEREAQIVISGNQLPRKMYGIDARLVSLLESGNIAAIVPPDIELRTAIVTQELRSLPDVENMQEVATYIAEEVASNSRELIAAVNRVRVYASSNQQVPNLDLVKQALSDVIDAPSGEKST